VAEVLATETAAGLHDITGYVGLRQRVERQRRAPGKGNTLLNYCGIRSDLIEYLVDRNPYEHGKFTPRARLPIHAVERLDLRSGSRP
jgi:hypothetical protein